jgi:hypothetical protein
MARTEIELALPYTLQCKVTQRPDVCQTRGAPPSWIQQVDTAWGTVLFNQERGLVVIGSPAVGLVAVLPVGMSVVSSVNLTPEVGAERGNRRLTAAPGRPVQWTESPGATPRVRGGTNGGCAG